MGSASIKPVIRVFALILAVGMMLLSCSAQDGSVISQSTATQPTASPTSQMDQGAETLFRSYFVTPDWAQLYKDAQVEDTPFEDAQDYAAYMAALIGDEALTLAKNGSAYNVCLGTKTVAGFTVTQAGNNWVLETLSLVIDRNVSCHISVNTGSTVTVNGVELDDSYVVKTTQTHAEDYLPDGLHGHQTTVYRVKDLLSLPEIKVSQNGEDVDMEYAPDSCTYYQTVDCGTITDDEKNTLVSASKIYCRYMIGNVGSSTVRKYFDSNSHAYKTMTSIAKWMQKYLGYRFADAQISEFHRYSDELYSAKVTMSMFVTRKDNTEKEYPFHCTLLMKKQGGAWIVDEMVNFSLEAPIETVRIDFVQDGNIVDSQMVSSDAISVSTPAVKVPDGKFLGWYTENAETPLLVPGENGVAAVPYGTVLQPMTLTVRFDDEAIAPDTEAEWEGHIDNIRLETMEGTTYTAHVMIIRDPSQVYMGTSSPEFSKNTPGKRLPEAMEDEGAIAAINAGAFYDDGTSNLIVGSMPEGLVIAGGKVVWNKIQMGMPENGFVGFDQDNKLIVATSMTSKKAMELGIRDGCCFGPALIMDGAVNEKVYNAAPHYNPRTAIGQRADGAVIFLCIEGRIANSMGGTYKDIIDIMLRFGAVNACNLDGGSSTVMLYRDPVTGEADWVNTYSVLQAEARRMPNFFMVRPAKEK